MSAAPLAAQSSPVQNLPSSGGTYAPVNGLIRGSVLLGEEPYTSPHHDFDAFGYRGEEILGFGGYGFIRAFRHRDRPSIRYACKLLDKDRTQRDQLMKEVQLIRDAQHRHVIELVETYEDTKWSYIVMLPAAERNLHQYLKIMNDIQMENRESWVDFGNRRLQLFKWMYCLAVTLKELHSRNIRHRDIKPQNILINGSNILFTDFGISFSIDGLTNAAFTRTIGTTQYEPPEAFQGNTTDPQTRVRTGRLGDVFSLGCVFFEMLVALCRPVLGTSFPAVPDEYSRLCGDAVSRSKVAEVTEHAGLRKRLPEHCRFPGLTEDLLGVVTTCMMADIQHRSSSAAIVSRMEDVLARHQVPLMDCCAHGPGAEPLDQLPTPPSPPAPQAAPSLSIPSSPPTPLSNPTTSGPGGLVSTSTVYRPKIRPPRKILQERDVTERTESMRKALQAVLSTETLTFGFDHYYRAVYRAFLTPSMDHTSHYKVVLECVDEFVDQQTLELHSLCCEKGDGSSQQEIESSIILEICKCLARAWDPVAQRLEWASDVTMFMTRNYCNPKNQPVVYYHGVMRFNDKVPENTANQIKDFLKSDQPGADDQDGLPIVQRCTKIFAVIQQVSQRGIHCAANDI